MTSLGLMSVVGVWALQGPTDSVLEPHVRQEILRSLETWEQRMSRVEGTLKGRHTVLAEKRKTLRTREKLIRFQFNGAKRRADRVLEDGKLFAFSINSRYRFLVACEGQGHPFVLRGLDLKNQQKADPSTLGYVEVALTSPFALHPGVQRVRDLLAHPANRVTAFETRERQTDGGERVLTLDIGNQQCPIKQATIHLDPRNEWCIRKFEALDRNGIMPYRSTITYGAQSAGAWYPREIFYEFYLENERGAGGESMTDEFTELSVCEAPERAFTLSAFGLPEPASAGGGQSWLTATTLFATGGALAAIGAMVYWIASRRRSTS